MISKVDIQAVPYRKFVNVRPNQTSYFQPILDTLEVQPSHFDYSVGGLIVEGKSDYYILRFCSIVTGIDIGPIFPAFGSGTMGALVSLHRGWGLPVRVLHDSDPAGRIGKQKLDEEFNLSENEHVFLDELNSDMKKIEDVFEVGDKNKLTRNSKKKRKAALLIIVQEHLASGKKPELSERTLDRMKSLLSKLKQFLEIS